MRRDRELVPATLALMFASLALGCSDDAMPGAGVDAGVTAGTGVTGGAAGAPPAGMGAGAGGVAGAGTGGTAGGGGAPDAGRATDAGVAGTDAGTSQDAGTDAGAAVEPAEPGVRFVGRTDEREAGVVRLAWSGSGILFRFDGTEASVLLDDPGGFFSVLVDGELQPTLETGGGERSYQVASGLPQGTHAVELYRRTEALFGVTRFFDVDLAGGALLAPPPPKARRLELVGNSITAGYGNEGSDAFCSFEARTENHYLTYGAITARNLDAELATIAWSGKGVVFNYGDDTVDPMPVLYPRALPDDPTSSWDFARWQPHAVVINLGTNDFSTDGDPTEAQFGDAYRDFLLELRDHYPDAVLVCLVPTLLSGDDLTTARSYVEAVVDGLAMDGDDRIEAVALDFTTDGFGCDYHPSLATHAAMAEALTAELRRILGW